jgi:organic hydroperoxide reductase OsmC/OhrA
VSTSYQIDGKIAGVWNHVCTHLAGGTFPAETKDAKEGSMQAKKVYKSFTYRTALLWSGRRRCEIYSSGKPILDVSSPPEFKGDPDIWTPEDLFVASVNVCLMTTFLAYCQSRGLEIQSYGSEAEGTLEHADGKFRITSIALHPHIQVGSEADIEKAREVLATAKSNCLVSNSIFTQVTVFPQISARVDVSSEPVAG